MARAGSLPSRGAVQKAGGWGQNRVSHPGWFGRLPADASLGDPWWRFASHLPLLGVGVMNSTSRSLFPRLRWPVPESRLWWLGAGEHGVWSPSQSVAGLPPPLRALARPLSPPPWGVLLAPGAYPDPQLE